MRRRASLVLGLLLLAPGCPPPQPPPVAGRAPRPLPPEQRARAEQGLQALRQGDHPRARQLLTSVLAQAEGEDRIPLLAALAHTSLQRGELVAAARHAGELEDLTRQPAERALARRLLTSALAGLGEELPGLQQAAAPGSALRRAASLALAARAEQSGDGRTAARLRAEALGSESSAALPAIGLLVPRSGQLRLAGEQLLSGAAAGAGLFRASAPLRILLEDDSQDPVGAARALLSRDVLALIGGPSRPESARAVAALAASAGAPFLSAACGEPVGAGVLCLLPSGQARAAALARLALGRGLRSFALLLPRSSYGRQMAGHFTSELRRGGGKVVVELEYPEGAQSFTAQVTALAARSFQALFVPDTAAALSLLGPALGSAGLWSAASLQGRSQQRQIAILATADGLSPGRLAGASRYLQGALLAPGFVAEGLTGAAARSQQELERELGQPPSLLQAFAADAAAALRAALASCAEPTAGAACPLGRAALLARLRQQQHPGLTGSLGFAADGARLSPGQLYQLEGERLHGLP